MNEAKKTVIFAAAAAVLVVLAAVSAPRPYRAEAPFLQQGEAFYPSFADPLKATSLQVVDYQEATGTAKIFKVELKDGKWSIPSHHHYPADAKDRLAKTAAAMIDLKKDAIRSDRAPDHEAFGVLDPLDDKVTGFKGRGKRVTLRDKDGQVLADFVFGKETRDGSGMTYVRIPGEKRVYAVKRKPDISAKFEDWIETDLLQLGQFNIRKVVIDHYSIDEVKGEIKDRSTHSLSRDTSSDPWKFSDLKPNEELNSDNVSQIMTALDDLKIVGVRPKPAVLTRDLKASGDFKVKERMPPQMLQAIDSLRQKGYYFARQGNQFEMVSNEGELQVSCDDGVLYTLRFGEVLVGEGEEITAGSEEKKEDKKDDKKKGQEARYMFVTARFEEPLLGTPPAEPKAYVADPNKKPEEQKADEEKAKKEKEEYDQKKKDFDKKVEDGKKRVKELTDRFADWYYVISDESFRKLRRGRPELVKPKEEKKPEGEKKPEDKKPEDKKPEEKKPEEKK